MVSGPRAKVTELIQNGALAQIPGLIDSGKPLLAVVQSGSLDVVNGVASQGVWAAPCDCSVVGAFATVITQLGTGAATVGAGRTSNTDDIVDDYSVAISLTAGTVVDLTDDASFLGGDLALGETITFQGNNGATSTGAVNLALVIVVR